MIVCAGWNNFSALDQLVIATAGDKDLRREAVLLLRQLPVVDNMMPVVMI